MAVYLLCYAAAFLLAESGYYLLSGLGLGAAALYLYVRDYRDSGNMLHLRAVYSLAFVGGQALACMKLSWLSPDWSPVTWAAYLAAYVGFYGVFSFLESRDGPAGMRQLRRPKLERTAPAVFFCACAVAVLSIGCFAIEAAMLGFIPLLVQGVPHAYSSFHITGIHYFTVSCVLVPAISVIYFCIDRGKSRGRTVLLLLMDVLALAIPILCVSRFQLLFAVFLAVLVYLQMEERLNLFYAAAALAALVPLYILLTAARSHDAAYLNAVFEMKQESLSIFITQPYMYVANNYDNFDLLVKGITGFTLGRKMLTPLWTLTGLKFFFPSLMAAPVFVTKEELTTLTLYYDSYCDFGLVGVLLLSCLLGAVSYWLMQAVRQARNPMLYLFYAQFTVYLLLSFFTTWFSNPTTWFYLAATAVMALIPGMR